MPKHLGSCRRPLVAGATNGKTQFTFEPGRLNRHIALQHDAVEISQLAHIVVAIGLVQQRAVIPHNEIARPPLVTVLVLRLSHVLQQVGEQGQGIRFRHSDDALGADRIDVDRLAAAFRVGANNRMSHRVGDTAAAFRTQLHQLPRAVTALVDMDCFQAVEAAFGFLRQFVVGEAHIGVLGIAAQVGQAHGVQNCGLWRAGCIRVVSVIAFAGNVTPPVGIEILVRDVVDERTLGQRKAGIVLREGFAEQADCLEQLVGR